MKKRISFGFAVAVAALSCFADAAQKVDVTVGGMVCSFCAQGITKKFKARPEVEGVNVALADQKVHLTVKDGTSLDDSVIKALLKESGYAVEKVERGVE